MSSQILLYSGVGSGPASTQALENQVRELCDEKMYQIHRINSFSEVLYHPFAVKALFVPGGNAGDLWGFTGLMDQASQVREIFDKYRISYYGACAGGILSTTAVHGGISPHVPAFKNQPFPEKYYHSFNASPTSLLGLLPIKSIAPLFSQREEKLSFKDFRLLNIKTLQTNTSIPSPYILGPGYLALQDSSLEILTTYKEELPIYKTLRWKNVKEKELEEVSQINPTQLAESLFYKRPSGSSIVVTGTHLEIDSKTVRSSAFKAALNATNEEVENLAEKMVSTDPVRLALLRDHLEKMGIVCKKV